MSYQGWANYETWAVALWLSNNEGDYRYWQEKTQEAYLDAQEDHLAYNTPSEEARMKLADCLKEEMAEAAPDLGASVWADLLSAALSEVDYFEIADNWLSEIDGYEQKKAVGE
jgi:hypothetical protein